MRGLKQLKAVVNPDNRSVLNWLTLCHSREIYEDQSLYHVIDLPIPENFYRDANLAVQIRSALAGEGMMDNAAQFATKLELKRTFKTGSKGIMVRVLR